MAELKFKNEFLAIYATPKCGISSTVRMIRRSKGILDTISNAVGNCIIVRNPWLRMISFYVDKIIQHRAIHIREQLCQLDFRETPLQKDLRKRCLIEDISNITFSKFISLISELDDDVIERHLKSQNFKVENIYFDYILKLEQIDFDIKKMHSDLNFLHLNDSSAIESEYGDGRKVHNLYFRRNVDSPEAYNMTPDELRKNGIPIDYKYFFNAEIKNIISKRYAEDIDRFEYEFPFE